MVSLFCVSKVNRIFFAPEIFEISLFGRRLWKLLFKILTFDISVQKLIHNQIKLIEIHYFMFQLNNLFTF